MRDGFLSSNYTATRYHLLKLGNTGICYFRVDESQLDETFQASEMHQASIGYLCVDERQKG